MFNKKNDFEAFENNHYMTFLNSSGYICILFLQESTN